MNDIVNNMDKIIAVYGTLKKGHYNYDYLLKDNSELLGVSKTEGVMQLANEGYPYLFEGANRYGVFDDPKTYDIEIYKINDETFESIDHMERCAGYYPKKIDTPFGEAVIYYASHSLFNVGKAIISKY